MPKSFPKWLYQFNQLLVRLLSCVQLFATPWTACQASLSFSVSWSLLKLMSTELVMPSNQSNHLILCWAPFSCLQAFPASGSFLMSQVSASGGQSFSFSTSPSNEYSGLISFRIDWFDLFAAQGILKSLLQHHSSKASIHQILYLFFLDCLPLSYWLKKQANRIL